MNKKDKELLANEITKQMKRFNDLIPEYYDQNTWKETLTTTEACYLGKYCALETLLLWIEKLPEES